MKKKILIISQNFWPENFPINDVVFELAKKNKIDVLTGKPNYPKGVIYKGYSKFFCKKEIISKNLSIIRVPIFPRYDGNKLTLVINYLSFVFSGILFGTIYLYNKKYNNIFVYCPSPISQIIVGIYFKILKNTKLFTWVQDLWPESIYATNSMDRNLLYNFLKKICNSIYKQNDKLFLQSKSFFNYFSKSFKNIEKIYLPNHGKEFIFKKKRIKKNLFDKKKLNILYTGNIGKAQNFYNLLKAAKKIEKKNKNIFFHFIGEGSYKNKAIKIKNKMNIKNIKFYNYMNNKKLNFYIKESDILLVTLNNDPILNITVPSKFQNYLAAKKPILSFASGETAKLTKHSKSGFNCNPNQISNFVKLVLKIYNLKNSKILKIKSKNAYNYYRKNFHLKIITNKIIKNLN